MATQGHSTTFEYGDGATAAVSHTWTEFARITEIKPPEIEADDIDVSHMKSAEQFKEFDPGWAEAGELELTVEFDKTDNGTVYGLFRQKKGFRMTFVDGSKWTFDGYVKKFQNEVDREGIITANVTVKISGKPAFTAGV